MDDEKTHDVEISLLEHCAGSGDRLMWFGYISE
jgi:hypothetical protein